MQNNADENTLDEIPNTKHQNTAKCIFPQSYTLSASFLFFNFLATFLQPVHIIVMGMVIVFHLLQDGLRQVGSEEQGGDDGPQDCHLDPGRGATGP